MTITDYIKSIRIKETKPYFHGLLTLVKRK